MFPQIKINGLCLWALTLIAPGLLIRPDVVRAAAPGFLHAVCTAAQTRTSVIPQTRLVALVAVGYRAHLHLRQHLRRPHVWIMFPQIKINGLCLWVLTLIAPGLLIRPDVLRPAASGLNQNMHALCTAAQTRTSVIPQTRLVALVAA